MSYPEPRYHGESGEISAVYRLADQKPELTIGSGTAVARTERHAPSQVTKSPPGSWFPTQPFQFHIKHRRVNTIILAASGLILGDEAGISVRQKHLATQAYI